MDNTPNPFSGSDHPTSPGSGSSGHNRLGQFRHWNYHVMGFANIVPEQRQPEIMISTPVADSSIRQAGTQVSYERPHGASKESSYHDVTKLIESISDSDIDNLRGKIIRRGIEQSQNPNIPIKKRQQYEANKNKYVTVFRSIRENLRGKSPYERVKAIQAYLLGDKNDAKRKIFEELLRGKTSDKGKEHADQSSSSLEQIKGHLTDR